ncbi:hypothetical protein N9Y42_06145 [Mariniblastus sp.]|nr:hypothetical protein [Mariniblastus sp.]
MAKTTKKPTAKKTTNKKTSAKKTSAKKSTTTKKATKAKSTKKSAEAEELNETGRRKSTDRRSKKTTVAAEAAAPVVERRKTKRRRQIDPTTCERDYSDLEIEFMQAMDEYKRASGRMFPTCSEILEVVIKMGYRKVADAQSLYNPEQESGTSGEVEAFENDLIESELV